MNSNYIHEYIYDKRRQLKGVWAATPSEKNPNQVYVGFSLCNKSKGDRFNKRMGLDIALGRSASQSIVDVPSSLHEGYEFFLKRCSRYFKDKTIIA